MKCELKNIILLLVLSLGVISNSFAYSSGHDASKISLEKGAEGQCIIKAREKILSVSGIRTSVKSLVTVRKWIDDGIELTIKKSGYNIATIISKIADDVKDVKTLTNSIVDKTKAQKTEADLFITKDNSTIKVSQLKEFAEKAKYADDEIEEIAELTEYLMKNDLQEYLMGCAVSAGAGRMSNGKFCIFRARNLLHAVGSNLRTNVPALTKLVDDIELNPALEIFLQNNPTSIKAWEFAIEGAAIRFKPDVLEKISIALNRGIKEIPDVVSHANHPNIVTYTVEHIFRGHGANGGRHQISALIADNTRKLTDRLKETADGFYEAVI
jgi:hypothetical protein